MGDVFVNQEKIGKFIKSRRKEIKLTQAELAEKLNVTDRSISKWENGICMPDSSIIPVLCDILNITINDLFSGEIVDKKDNIKILESNLLNVFKDKEEFDKALLNYEIILGVVSIIFVFIIIIVSSILVEYKIISEGISLIYIISSLVYFLFITFFALKIEQVAGYYLCNRCKHKHIPCYINVNLAMHIGRTRYMKCPKCNKYSWNKKVVSLEDKND